MLTTFLYRKGKPLETNVSRAQMLAALSEKDALLWVDLEAPNEFESDCLVEIFNFHGLAIEDCITDVSHPKVDDYEEYLFLVMHAVELKSKDVLSPLELDVFLGKNYVVTFHKDPVESMDRVREKVRRKMEYGMDGGADRLAYSILDHLVDNYIPALEQYEERIDKLEDEIFNPARRQGYRYALSTIMQIRRDIFQFRRIVAPQRDTLNFLTRNPTPFIKTENMIYFRDIYDHLFKIYGTVDGLHDAMTGIIQAYFSYSSHQLNETIQRMTLLATLTMPAMIIASIYGMNFRSIPELAWPHGYFFALGLMALTSLSLLLLMKFKKWI